MILVRCLNCEISQWISKEDWEKTFTKHQPLDCKGCHKSSSCFDVVTYSDEKEVKQ